MRRLVTGTLGDSMRIIAAPNAFKGSIDALEAAEAIKKGILAACPDCDVICIPVADGGDSLTEVLNQALSGTIVGCTVHGPLMEERSSTFSFIREKRLAVVEMAKASGLALVPERFRDPTETTSYGTGELIRSALDMGAQRIVVGLGGSATCDGGIGMASALGYRFLDHAGAEVSPVGKSLPLICSIDSRGVDTRVAQVDFDAVCDVINPLTGSTGASYVYSPQKGASQEQVELLDEGLENLASIIKTTLDVDILHISGAGAAGGLGGGIHAFLGARLKKGIDLVLDIVNFKDNLRGADLVITAEGQIDFQTKYDKAPAGVARSAQEAGVPCIAVCGGVGERIDELYDLGFNAVFSICKGPQSLESAIQAGPDLLAHTVEQVVRTFLLGRK